MQKKFEKLLDFVRFMHEFREIVRYEGSKLGKKVETDSEHSYQVAMVAWFLIDENNLKLNKELCLMYSLTHDLVEVYAGDTFVFDKKRLSSQHEREKGALIKIKKRFPYFNNLIKIIENYEKKEDGESKFIYAVDKIISPLQIYIEGGKLWHEKKVSFLDAFENKDKKIAVSSDVYKYWQELLKEFKKNKKMFYN
ncbi:MAG: HD domain-containing protein [Candidatus Paceibacterota bacterium]|jgi:putative hydrolase of HD superfamily